MTQWFRRQGAAYGSGEHRPLSGYLTVMGGYLLAAAAAAVGAAARASGRRPDARMSPWDLVITAAASHKLARLVAKDSVTSPLRAPFTHYEHPAGEAELAESVRHQDGLKHAVGEMLTCPFCLDQWTASGLMAGRLLAPRMTRIATGVLATTALADAYQLGYGYLKKIDKH